jgi:hypothetical protein
MKAMRPWQRAWPAVIACCALAVTGCANGSSGADDGRPGTDGSPAVPGPAADAGLDAGLALDAARALDAPPDAPPPTGSPCVVLAAQLTMTGEAPPPGLSTPPSPAVPQGDPTRLSPHEIVQRLARFIWRMDADAALLARVQGCTRLTGNDVLLLADLMLRDPRAARGIQAFVAWWLQLDLLETAERDPASFPPFTSELRRAMAEEPRIFAAHVMFNDDGTLPRLLSAPYTFVDRELAAIYDLPAVDDSFRRVDFRPEDQRAGLLTMPGVLAVAGGYDRHSGPARANRLLERVTCFAVPPPPPEVMPEIPPPAQRPGQSLRQAMEASLASPVCRACHALLEVGFAFEPFDAVGRRRTTDNGAPIDAHVRLRNQAEGNDIEVNGPVALAEALVTLDSTRRCFARRWVEFAIGRPTAESDEPVIDGLTRLFKSAGLDIRTLIARVTVTPQFLN